MWICSRIDACIGNDEVPVDAQDLAKALNQVCFSVSTFKVSIFQVGSSCLVLVYSLLLLFLCVVMVSGVSA